MTTARDADISPEGGPTKPPLGAASLAILAAVVTISLKLTAFAITGSAGLLSDAAESLTNLVTAFTALFAVWYAARPVDRSHNYGHGKVEFFASGVEGTLILIAAIGIGWVGMTRLLSPQPLESLGIGAVIAGIASAINFAVARFLFREAHRHRSLALEADARHLMTDVYTSAGVIIGLGLIWLTDILWLDALIAIALAVNIAWTGFQLLRQSVDGLMDRALPMSDQEDVRLAIESRLCRDAIPGATYHALRTRRAGARRFADFHLLVPGDLSVHQAHELTNRLERDLEAILPGVETTVHIEPIEAAESWRDSALLHLEPTYRTGREV